MATELIIGVCTTPDILKAPCKVLLDDPDVGEGVDVLTPAPDDCEVSMVSDSGSGSGGKLANLRLISMNILLYIDKSCSDNFSMGFPVTTKKRDV